MHLRIIPVLVLVFLKVVILKEVHSDEFAVVSTSQPPSDFQQPPDQLREQLKLYTKLDENIRQLDTLNTKITKIQERLSTLTTFEANMSLKFDSLNKEIVKIQERLKDVTNSGTQKLVKQTFPKHCKEVQERGYTVTGIYSIQPEFAPEPFLVRCNMDIRGGGWTNFHKRYDGSQDFYLGWEDYKQGFGNLAGEFWLGLEHLYQLTGHEVNELLIELVDWNLKRAYAHYNIFSIGNEREGYFLKALGEYSGNGGDSMAYQAGSKFSTKDRDQDSYKENCATSYVGAWWFKACFNGHLNGQYLSANLSSSEKNKGLSWIGFRGDFYSLKEARMMVRPH